MDFDEKPRLASHQHYNTIVRSLLRQSVNPGCVEHGERIHRKRNVEPSHKAQLHPEPKQTSCMDLNAATDERHNDCANEENHQISAANFYCVRKHFSKDGFTFRFHRIPFLFPVSERFDSHVFVLKQKSKWSASN
jgi:hypothetical protein